MDPGVELTNGKGEEEAVDLADPSTKVIRTPPSGELGSAYSGEALFLSYEKGGVFETKDWRDWEFEEMLRADGKAKTLEQVLTLPLRAAEWSIDPADGDSGEAEAIREDLERPANAGGMTTPLELVIGQMTSAVVLRRAYFEKVFQAVEGRINYRKLAFRPARTCYLLRDKNDFSFKGFSQRFRAGDEMKRVVIPADKAFVYIHGQHRDPLYGTSDLETARNLFESKQKVRFLWYSFLENQTIPKAIAHHNTTDDGEKQEFAKKVATLKGGGVVGIGPDQDVTAFESSGRGADVFRQAMDYLSSEMSGSVLAGFTDLTSAAASGKGSFALSKDASDFFMMSRVAELKEMGAVLTSWVIADLCRWNYGMGAACPVLTFKPPAQEAVEQSFTLLEALATAQQPVPIPTEFIDLLTEKVASYLGISTDVVHKAIQAKQEQAPQDPTSQLRVGIDAATQLVRQAGLSGGSLNSPAPAAA